MACQVGILIDMMVIVNTGTQLAKYQLLPDLFFASQYLSIDYTTTHELMEVDT
jgi:hypothetical protein